MIRLSSVIDQFEADFLKTYQQQILPSQLKALASLKICRTQQSPVMQVNCSGCEYQTFVPHSCGHRNCPHCQHHESQQWIERQVQKQVPARYFMLTFTLPAQLRALTWFHQKQVYALMFECVWETLQAFSRNDNQLKGDAGAIAVLHTHNRALGYHPHIHAVMPAAIVDKASRLWRTKKGKYLFSHKALAKVFRQCHSLKTSIIISMCYNRFDKKLKTCITQKSRAFCQIYHKACFIFFVKYQVTYQQFRVFIFILNIKHSDFLLGKSLPSP